MTARYLLAFDRIRELLDARRQSEPLLEAEEIQALLGGWPNIRTIQRYMENIRGDAIVAKRQTSGTAVDIVKPNEDKQKTTDKTGAPKCLIN